MQSDETPDYNRAALRLCARALHDLAFGYAPKIYFDPGVAWSCRTCGCEFVTGTAGEDVPADTLIHVHGETQIGASFACAVCIDAELADAAFLTGVMREAALSRATNPGEFSGLIRPVF